MKELTQKAIRRRNVKGLNDLFARVVELVPVSGMEHLGHVGIDPTRIAVNAYRIAWTRGADSAAPNSERYPGRNPKILLSLPHCWRGAQRAVSKRGLLALSMLSIGHSEISLMKLTMENIRKAMRKVSVGGSIKGTVRKIKRNTL